MTTTDELVDSIAGMALFADLTTPQLEAVAHRFEERLFPEGERILRQGLSGSGFYVIVEGAASVVVDATPRATLIRGDFFGEVSILLGESPVAGVGTAPGGLQLSYALDRLGVRHAVISADDAPGGMFRRWPFFQRLLSWTKPFAPAEHGTRRYERYDWNSLVADEPQHRALAPRFMDGTSYFPSRAEMEQNLVEFATATGIRVRYG